MIELDEVRNMIENISTMNVEMSELEQEVKIQVSIPDELNLNGVEGIKEVYEDVQKHASLVKRLAFSAYRNKDKLAWDHVQNLLYYWNYRDLTRVKKVLNDTSLVEDALRNIVLDIQQQYLNPPQLQCINEFTPERAVQEMFETANSHRINHHPLLDEMSKNGLNKKTTRLFLENYYVNNRLFHLFIVALTLSAPLERRTGLANNFYDEMGSGEKLSAHPTLFLKNFNSLGRPTVIKALPEAFHLVNEKMFVSFLAGDYHYGMGGFGYIELTMPNQMRKILSGLQKSGLPQDDLEFWEMHITLDEVHGKTWFTEMLTLIKTPEQAQKCFAGGMRLLNARASMYDGIMNG